MLTSLALCVDGITHARISCRTDTCAAGITENRRLLESVLGSKGRRQTLPYIDGNDISHGKERGEASSDLSQELGVLPFFLLQHVS